MECTNKHCQSIHSWCNANDIVTNEDMKRFKSLPYGISNIIDNDKQHVNVEKQNENSAESNHDSSMGQQFIKEMYALNMDEKESTLLISNFPMDYHCINDESYIASNNEQLLILLTFKVPINLTGLKLYALSPPSHDKAAPKKVSVYKINYNLNHVTNIDSLALLKPDCSCICSKQTLKEGSEMQISKLNHVKQCAIFIESNHSKFIKKTYLNGITISGNMTLRNITKLINILRTDGDIINSSPHGKLSIAQLNNIKLCQKNSCYVIGLSRNTSSKKLFSSNEWFGQFGEIYMIKIYNHSSRDVSALIIFDDDSSALNAINYCNNNNFSFKNWRVLKATHATTNYCRSFLLKEECKTNDCLLLHSWMGNDDIVTQNQIDLFHAKPYGIYSYKESPSEDSKQNEFRNDSNSHMNNLSVEELKNIYIKQENMVYVSGLNQELCDQQTLKSEYWFGQFGEIKSAFYNNKNPSPKYGCSAFITYYKDEDALRAIEVVNGYELDDGGILKAKTGCKQYCLSFLLNSLCQNASCTKLHHFANEEDIVCEEDLNDFGFDDDHDMKYNVYDDLDEDHPHKNLSFEELKEIRMPQNNKLYIKGLPIKLCNKQILGTDKWFGKFGTIKQITINKEFVAFITFEQQEDAVTAIENMSGYNLGNDRRLLKVMTGRTSYCSYFLRNTQCKIIQCTLMHEWMDKNEIIICKKDEFHKNLSFEQLQNIRIIQPHLLYVKNIPIELCVDEILTSTKWFGSFGKIERIHYGSKAKSSMFQFAYIEYNDKNPDAVNQAIKYLNGYRCNNGKIMVVMAGYTFYCSLFLQNFKCQNKSCFGLHEWASTKNIVNKNIIKKQERDPFYDNLSFQQLKNLRIRQSNLVYVVGLPEYLCDQPTLNSNEWLGKFGKIENINFPKQSIRGCKQNTFTAFITFGNEKNAHDAIQYLNGYHLNDGAIIRATIGCKRFCGRFLTNTICANTNCQALHEWANIKHIVNKYEEPSFPDVDKAVKPQQSAYDLYSISDQECKLKFEQWLDKTVGLSQYLPVFREHEYDDIKMIKYFDDDNSTQDVIKNELGINNELHCKLLIEKINEFHKMMKQFHQTLQIHQQLLQYAPKFEEKGILTLYHLKQDIKTSVDVKNVLGIYDNYKIQIILSIILNIDDDIQDEIDTKYSVKELMLHQPHYLDINWEIYPLIPKKIQSIHSYNLFSMILDQEQNANNQSNAAQ